MSNINFTRNYWSKLSEMIDNYYPNFNSRKPDANAYYLPLGNKSVHISMKVNSQKIYGMYNCN